MHAQHSTTQTCTTQHTGACRHACIVASSTASHSNASCSCTCYSVTITLLQAITPLLYYSLLLYHCYCLPAVVSCHILSLSNSSLSLSSLSSKNTRPHATFLPLFLPAQ